MFRAVRLSWLGNVYSVHAHFIRHAVLTRAREVGQTDLVLDVRSGFINRFVHTRLKSPRAAFMICTTLVNPFTAGCSKLLMSVAFSAILV